MNLSGEARVGQIADLVEEQVRSEGVDIVEFPEFGGEGVIFQRRNPAFPTVLRLHGPTRLCAVGAGGAVRALVRRYYLRKAGRDSETRERESVSRAHAVVSPSQWLVKELRKRRWPLPDGTLVVPNPFSGGDVDDHSAPEYRDRGVLFLGKLNRLKGADLIPDICAGIWAEIPGTICEIVGQETGTWCDFIRSRVSEQHARSLKIRGGVPHSSVRRYLARASVAVFASVVENFPYTVLEAMSAGVTCVVGSLGGAQELGRDGESVIHTARKAEAIAKAVVCLLKDPASSRRIGEAGRLWVKDYCDASEIARSMHEIYGRVILTAAN